jgi:uncharacterized protein (DUF2141 family)
MKILLALVVLASAADAARPVPAPVATTVTVHGVASNRGVVFVSLCTAAEFLKSCALSRKVQARRGDTTVHFDTVPAGRYAPMAYHDENRNSRLDRTSIGIPSEGYGFGRGAAGNQGPPAFAAASLSVPAPDGRIDVSLRY